MLNVRKEKQQTTSTYRCHSPPCAIASFLSILFFHFSSFFSILGWVIFFRFLSSGTLMRVAGRMASRYWCPFFSISHFSIVDYCSIGIRTVNLRVNGEGLSVSGVWCSVHWARLGITIRYSLFPLVDIAYTKLKQYFRGWLLLILSTTQYFRGSILKGTGT